MKLHSLGYLNVRSVDPQQWRSFGVDLLGMAVSPDPLGRDDAVALTVDDRPARLQVTKGEQNELGCVGWEIANAAEYHDSVRELTAAGVEINCGSAEELTRAQVREMAYFHDPGGIRHEIFWGQLQAPGSFHSGRALSGFVTGAQGLGHVVLLVPDLEKALDFYTSRLGFRVTDEIDLNGIRVVFMHINDRHHSLALGELAGHRGLHHLMVQVGSLDDVGVGYDLCRRDGHPITMTLGRHTNDRMTSFYVRSPGGFDIEYGWGAVTVDDDDWAVTHMRAGSIWGHHSPEDAPAPGCLQEI